MRVEVSTHLFPHADIRVNSGADAHVCGRPLVGLFADGNRPNPQQERDERVSRGPGGGSPRLRRART